ncbi:MAG TPA: acyl-CoA thioesterase [Flavobacterium sp.]|nr:acyl-CoA thioesterase [Flavobacterium sp.]
MIKRKEPSEGAKAVTSIYQFRVRFNETDPLGIVWHGNYLVYFEEGREAFGREHNLTYLDIENEGFVVPIVKSECEHKLSLKYGEYATIETTLMPTLAAKMIFVYKIFNEQNKLVCTGKTTQVFVDKEGVLSLNNPAFYEKWKQKMGI